MRVRMLTGDAAGLVIDQPEALARYLVTCGHATPVPYVLQEDAEQPVALDQLGGRQDRSLPRMRPRAVR
jgi:hypothetical protein